MKNHVCREGENLGVEWLRGYPHAVTYCVECRRDMRRIPVDDLSGDRQEVVFEILDYVRERRRRP